MRGERLYGLTIKCTHADAHRRILIAHTKTQRPKATKGKRPARRARAELARRRWHARTGARRERSAHTAPPRRSGLL